MDYAILKHPSLEEIENGFQKWMKESPDFRVETRGTSVEGRPILLGRVSDAEAADEDKQVVLLTAIHAGREINATNALLRLTKWLLSSEPLARQIRAHTIVLVMPVINPDWYERIQPTELAPGQSYKSLFSKNNIKGADLYKFDDQGGWSWDGPTDSKRAPEAAALFSVMEEYQPEASLDTHGLWAADSTLGFEFSGKSGQSFDSHTYCRELIEAMDQEAERYGFPQVRFEEDSGRIKVNNPIPGRNHHYIPCPNTYVYSLLYDRYHTLATINEMGFVDSGVIKARKLLEEGLRTWRREFYPGYPVNQVGYSSGMAVAAYGQTAATRRKSRVELWRKADQLLYGTPNAAPRLGKRMGYCFTAEGAAQYLRGVDTIALPDLFDRLADYPDLDSAYLKEFVRDTVMENIYGPADNHMETRQGFAAGAGEPIEHGLALRLFLPYDDARVTDIRLNGHLLAESPVDGFQIKHGSGTVVQYNIPPEKVGRVHIISCSYATDVCRNEGFGPADF